MSILSLKELEKLPAVRFEPNNNIPYWQDFSVWLGVPSDATFYIVGEAPEQHKGFYLAAKGYGAKEEYGDGSIMVRKIDCPNPIVAEQTK